MKTFRLAAAAMVCGSAALYGQMGRTFDWWTYAGDAQRTGWEKSDQKFVKEDVKNFKLLWSKKLEAAGKGPGRIAAPIVLGNLIGSRGFKELAFFQSSSGDLWSIDADLARPYWNRHFPAPQSACDGIATTPSLAPPVVFRFGARPATPAASPAPPASSAPAPTAPSGTPSGQGIPGGGPRAPAAGPPAGASPFAGLPPAVVAQFRVRPIYMLSPDGKLRPLNVDDSSDLRPPLDFLPGGMTAAHVNMSETIVYALARKCGDAASSVFAINLADPQPKPMEFKGAAPLQNATGAVLNSAGTTLFVSTGSGAPGADSHPNSLLAIDAKDLSLKDYAALPESAGKDETGMNLTIPVAFSVKSRELVATAGKDGRIYLFDAAAIGGSDHKTPLAKSDEVTKANGKDADKGIWSRLTTWEGTDGTRFLLATVWGPVASGLPAPAEGKKPRDGALVAFKVVQENGTFKLVPAWTSQGLKSPDAPVVAQGVVFALENGKYKRKVKSGKLELSPAGSARAVLYALDGATGKQIWLGETTAAGSLTGLTVANSRIYFTTVDNTVQVFGKYLEVN